MPIGDRFQVDGKSLQTQRFVVPTVCLSPRYDGHATTVEVGLSDVRAADSIRICYDFDRDGWVILQASVFSWPADDAQCDSDWQEVAFVQAWARERL